MARTTAAAINLILEETISRDLTTFITTANRMVTNLCTHDDYTASDLEEIERYLAAHFYHVAVSRADQEKAGDVSEKKRSKVDMGLNLTHYGQMAMQLARFGELAAHNKMITGEVTTGLIVDWIGEKESDVQDYT